MTRTWFCGMPRVSATPDLTANGTCVDDQIVTWSPCHSARIARGSIGTACEPVGDVAPATTTSAAAIAASASPLTIVDAAGDVAGRGQVLVRVRRDGLVDERGVRARAPPRGRGSARRSS